MRVVGRDLRPRPLAPGDLGDRVERVAVEVLAHVCARLIPDRQEDALALVVAGSVLMGLAEIAERDRTVDGRDDLGETDLGGRSAQQVPATDTPLRPDESGAFEGEKDLFEVRLGEPGALGDVSNRRRPAVVTQCQRQQCSTGVVASGGDAHTLTVGQDPGESVDSR